MKTQILLVASTLATLSLAHAQVVTYGDLDVSYVAPASTLTTLTTGSINISTSPNHQFIDPDTGTPSASAARYFGGTINWSGSANTFGSYARLTLGGSGPTIRFEVGDGVANWRIRNVLNESSATTQPFSGSTFDFIIKLEDAPWNTGVAKLFIGANANTLTEGTPDATVDFVNAMSPNQFTTLSWTVFHESWDANPATLTTTNMFSNNVWTPVSSIPEPSTYVLLAMGLGALVYLRRRSATSQA